MDFNVNKPIYRQIVDLCHSRILAGAWAVGCKVPSVRELSVELAVNPRTVLCAYEELEARQVIEPRRGMGFYLTERALEIVRGLRRDEFFKNTLSQVRIDMKELGISIEEVVKYLNQSK